MIQPMRLNMTVRITLIRIIEPKGIKRREFSRVIFISPGKFPNQLNSLGKYRRMIPVMMSMSPIRMTDFANILTQNIEQLIIYQ
jgi:hypothetical protein